MTIRTIMTIAIGWAALAGFCAPSQAFWQRSQLQACADATTESERLRRRCWELDPYLDPGLAMTPVWGGGPAPSGGRWGADRFKNGVTKRLG